MKNPQKLAIFEAYYFVHICTLHVPTQYQILDSNLQQVVVTNWLELQVLGAN